MGEQDEGLGRAGGEQHLLGGPPVAGRDSRAGGRALGVTSEVDGGDAARKPAGWRAGTHVDGQIGKPGCDVCVAVVTQ